MISYILDSLRVFWKTLYRGFEIAGMSHTAYELHRLGYMKEYHRTMDEIERMRRS